jgi:Ca-activated chloride channel family protein
MRLSDPWWLAVLLPLAVIAVWMMRRRPRVVPHPPLPALVAAGLPSGRWARLRSLPLLLRVAALVFLVLALARPQEGGALQSVTSHGVDIVLALDTSTSMTAQDFPPDRLAAARDVVDQFIAARPSDRVALVVFAGKALTRVPLTLDHAMLRTSLAEVSVGMLEDGTAIGEALAQSLARLRESPADSRLVVLLTDGINNQGAIDPITAARMATEMGVKVYTIGVGREGTFPQVVNDPAFGPRRVMVQTRVDEELLQEIAAETGGQYFRARDKGALEAIYDRIDRLEKHPIESTFFRQWHDRHAPLLATAVLLLLLEWGLSATRLRRFPG